MSSKQTRIEGEYSIVSVWENSRSWHANDIIHRAQVDMLIRKGFRVAELNGCWNGVEERSIRIEGIGHAKEARFIAATFNQEAFLRVGDRVAQLFSWSDMHRNYVPATYFTQQIEVTGAETSYTELQGFRFKFI